MSHVLGVVYDNSDLSCRDRIALCNVNVEMKESGLCDSQAHHDQCAKEQQIKAHIIESFKEARFGDMLKALNQATPNIGLD
jgi:hypothetical protein